LKPSRTRSLTLCATPSITASNHLHVREAAGKDPEGTLRLRAMQEGSHVIIEVSDDGAGHRGR
jgi:signal transduction histidine kinase